MTVDRRAIAQKLKSLDFGQPQNPKAWAYALRERELHHGGVLLNGKRMTEAQRTMWRAALGPDRQAPE
jgi:hypothetical protein